MAQAKDEKRWDHTAEIVAMLHNVNAKQRARRPASDFNPYRKAEKHHTPADPAQGAFGSDWLSGLRRMKAELAPDQEQESNV